MGKQPKRASRRERVRAERTTKARPADGLKIVIATSPQRTSAGPSVAGDVRLVRSALMYADHVELISPGALMIAALASMATQPTEAAFGILATTDEGVLRHLGFEGDIAEMRAVLSQVKAFHDLPRAQRRAALGAERSRQLREMVEEMVSKFRDGETGIEAVAADLWERAGAPDLAVAADAGLLSIATDAFSLESPIDQQVAQYSDTLRRLFADPSSHLMFDEQIAQLAGAMVREGRATLHPLAADHSLRAATGAGLVARLPAFPDAPIESILETRSELSEPLARYRVGVRSISDRLASDPLEPALMIELDDLWRDEVQPTLGALRRDLSLTRLVRDAALNLATDPKTVALGAAGLTVVFGLGPASDLTDWATGHVGAGGALVAGALGAAAREAANRHSKAKTHDLYYLLAAADQLR